MAAAITQAVQARMGADVEVSFTALQTFGALPASGDLHAVPDPGAMAGGPMRFALRCRPEGAEAVRLGRAEAIVRVRALHARAAHDIARGAVLTDADIELVIDEVGRVPLRPIARVMPGMKALRDVRGGDLLLARMFTGLALVKAGDEVVTRVSVGGIEVTGRAIAAQNGHFGRVIRLVNRESGKRLRGRVIGEREVEVFHES